MPQNWLPGAGLIIPATLRTSERKRAGGGHVEARFVYPSSGRGEPARDFLARNIPTWRPAREKARPAVENNVAGRWSNRVA